MNEIIDRLAPALFHAYQYVKTGVIEGSVWVGHNVVWAVNRTGLPKSTLWQKTAPLASQIWSEVEPFLIAAVNFLKTGYGVGIGVVLFSAYHIYNTLGRGYAPRIIIGEEPPAEFHAIRRPLSGTARVLFTVTHVSLLVLAGVAFTYQDQTIL